MNSRRTSGKILTSLFIFLMAFFVVLARSWAQEAESKKKTEKVRAVKTTTPPPKTKKLPPPPRSSLGAAHPNVSVQHVQPGEAGVKPVGGGNTNPRPELLNRRETINPKVVTPAGAGTNPPPVIRDRREIANPAVRPLGGPGANPSTAFHRVPAVTPPPFRPPPNVKGNKGPEGVVTYAHADGRRWVVDRNNHVQGFSKPGMEARFRENGRVSSLRVTRPNGEMIVRRPLLGGRQTVVVRPSGVRVVTYGRNRGYLERPLPQPGGYIGRTYVVENRTTVVVYRTYHYREIVYYRYVPAYRYHPRFYRWAYDPWRAPVVYSWGWGPAPWYGYYGGYFAPAPAYPTAALWLTDFLLAENLRLAYENRREAQRENDYEEAVATPEVQPGPQGVTLTPEVKAAIAAEVRQQIAAEQAETAQPVPPGGPPPQPTSEVAPPALDPQQRIFVVSMNLDASVAGQPCALTPGDILLRTGDSVVDGNQVAVNVLSSKPGDCPANSSTEIGVADLQEMHNQFRQQIDGGLKNLAETQGQNGLPAGPPADMRAVPEGTAPVDQSAAPDLAQQQADADQAEADATQGESGGS